MVELIIKIHLSVHYIYLYALTQRYHSQTISDPDIIANYLNDKLTVDIQMSLSAIVISLFITAPEVNVYGRYAACAGNVHHGEHIV